MLNEEKNKQVEYLKYLGSIAELKIVAVASKTATTEEINIEEIEKNRNLINQFVNDGYKIADYSNVNNVAEMIFREIGKTYYPDVNISDNPIYPQNKNTKK